MFPVLWDIHHGRTCTKLVKDLVKKCISIYNIPIPSVMFFLISRLFFSLQSTIKIALNDVSDKQKRSSLKIQNK